MHRRAWLVLVLVLAAAAERARAFDGDDPLADLEDPLEEDDGLSFDEEARRVEDGPEARQQPRQRQRQTAPPSREMQWWAKYAWSIVIGGAVLYALRGYWKSRPLASSYRRQGTAASSGTSSHFIKTVVSRADLDKMVSSSRLVLVDFSASWCGPCKEVHPIVEKVADEYLDDGLLVAEVDVDQAKDGIDEGVKTLPTFRVYVDGEFEGDYVGAPGLTEARRAVRKAINRMKLSEAPARDAPRAARTKTPPRTLTTKNEAQADIDPEIEDDVDVSGDNSLVTDADVDPGMLPTIEKLIEEHRRATGEPWKCTKVVSATGNEVRLIICCGDMCQRKTFSLPERPESMSNMGATGPQEAPTASFSPDPTLMKNPQIQELLQCGADACVRSVANKYIWPIPEAVGDDKKAASASASGTSSAARATSLPSEQPVHLTTMAQFSALCQEYPSTAIIVDFGATWCGPCQRIAPVFSQMAQQYGQQAIFCKVDTDESPSLKDAAGVSGIPHFVFYRGGAKFDDLVGANAGALLQKVMAAIAATPGGESSSSVGSPKTGSGSASAGIAHYVIFQGSNTKNTTSRRRAKIEANNFALDMVANSDGKVMARSGTKALASKAVLSSSELSQLHDLENVLERDNMWHAGKLSTRGIVVLGKMLEAWPHPFCVAALDLARIAVLHPDGIDAMARSAAELPSNVACFAEGNVGGNPLNMRLALRFCTNFVASAGNQGRRLPSKLVKKLLDICRTHLANVDDRPVRDAVSALLFNIVCSVLSELESNGHSASINCLSAATGIAVLLLGAEGKMSRQRGADSDKTTLLVIRRCLNVLAEIVARAPDAATGSTSANSGGVDMWLAIGNAATTVASSDSGIMAMRKKLLDAVAKKKVAEQRTGSSSSGDAEGAFPNPWA